MKTDLLIIGAGAGALSCAFEAQKNGIENIAIIEKYETFGGILNQCIHNGFGTLVFKEDITGPEYAKKLIDRINFSSINFFFNTTALKIDFLKRFIYVFSPEIGATKIFFKALVIATGCYEKSIGSFNIPGSRPAGIMTAGTAQKFINHYGYLPGNNVVIFGTNVAGLTVAKRLILEGAKVNFIIEPAPFCRGPLKDEYFCTKDYKIPILYSHTITKIIGKSRIERIEVSKVNEENQIIKGSCFCTELDSLLVAMELVPDNDLINNNNFIKIDENTKGPIVDQNMQTTYSGVYACGNNVYVHDMVDIVTKDSKNIGKSVKKFIKNFNNFEKIENKFIKVSVSKDFSFAVPQRINLTEIHENFLEIYLKPKKCYKNINIVVKRSKIGDVIFKKRINYLFPSKVEKVLVDVKDLNKNETEDIFIFLEDK